MLLSGKKAIITGTNRGIGKAILQKFAKEGAEIFAHARKETPEFVEFIKELSQKYNTKIISLYFDLTDTNAMKAAIKSIIKSKINIDILVNNAGVPHGGFFQMTPIDKIKEIFEINLFAQMEITQIVLKSMIRNHSGSIINISSILGLDLPVGTCAYGVSKAALIAWTKTLAAETGGNNIRINSIAPGLIDTDIQAEFEKKSQKMVFDRTSMKRFGTTAEIADVVTFLASDESEFINGQVIRVDGGVI